MTKATNISPVDLFDRLASIRLRQRLAVDEVLKIQEEIRQLDAEWDELEIQAVGFLEIETGKPGDERCVVGRCYEAGVQKQFAILLVDGDLVAREVISIQELLMIQPTTAYDPKKPYPAAHAAVAG